MRKLCAIVALIAASVADAGEGWTDLFNGKDLSGWVTAGKNWRVIQEGGEAVIECFKGGPSLTYKEPFGDAILDLWFRLPKGHNSGIFFRGSRLVAGGYPPPGTSYELQLYDHKDRWGHRTGDLLYPHRARRWASKPGQWNRCTIISVGYHHKGYLNGQCIFDVVDRGAPLKGYFCLQSHGAAVYFKRVRVRPIAGGKWPEDRGRLKALLFVGESRGIGKRVDLHGALIERPLDDSGLVDVTWSPDEIALEPEYLDGMDLLILYDNRPALARKYQERIRDFVVRGGGLIVLNRSVVERFENWPDFPAIAGVDSDVRLFGARAEWLPLQSMWIRVETPGHPVAAGIRRFAVRDDFVDAVRFAPAVTVVLENDARYSKRVAPQAWSLAYGRGRVFCTLLGQEAATLRHPAFGRLLVNAALWVCGPRPSERLGRLLAARDVTALKRLLHSPGVRDDWPVLDALGKLGAPAVPALAPFARGEGSLFARALAVRALGAVGEEAVESLSRLLGPGQPPAVRSAAAEALGTVGTDACVGILGRALADPDARLRQKALDTIGQIGSPAAAAALLGALRGDEPTLYAGALDALGVTRSATVRDALIDIATHRPAKYRAVLPRIARGLAGHLRHPGAFGAVVALLGSASPDARAAAARALAGSRSAKAHDVLLPLVFGADSAVGAIAEDYVRAAGKVDLGKHLSPFIRQWMIIGPFSNEGGRGARTAFPPEKEQKLDAAYDAVGGKARWQRVTAKGDRIDLAKLFPKHNQNTVAYAYVIIDSPADREVQMRTGSDDGIVAWLNGREVLRVLRPRGLTVDEDRTAVRLKKGENRLLLKIMQGGGDWQFCVRFANPRGNLAGLKWRTP